MSKLTLIYSRPAPAETACEDLVRLLEAKLDEARRGKLRGAATVWLYDDHYDAHATTAAKRCSTFTLGALRRLMSKIERSPEG